jgi:hypothetical protein
LSALLSALALLALATPASDRQARYHDLLRTYPSRPAAESAALVSALIDEGPFADRDGALFWMASVRLQARDLGAARALFARLRREHAGSPLIERADLGEAEASAQEGDYGGALRWLDKAAGASDAAVRELAMLSSAHVRALRGRQRLAWAAGLFALLVLALLVASVARRWPVPLRPLPAEARVLLPVLAVLALLSLRQDPAPRAAVLEVCAAGAIFSLAAGLSLRAGPAGLAGRALRAASALAALGACAYVAVWRADLISMVLETLRAGPE